MAKMAIRTAALRSLHRPPEELAPSDVPALLDAMRPMLNTLLGLVHTKVVITRIQTGMEQP